MHTFSRRALYDGYALHDLFRELDSGVNNTDRDILTPFNTYKAAGGEEWAEILDLVEA